MYITIVNVFQCDWIEFFAFYNINFNLTIFFTVHLASHFSSQ